jgi:hypothetical protein
LHTDLLIFAFYTNDIRLASFKVLDAIISHIEYLCFIWNRVIHPCIAYLLKFKCNLGWWLDWSCGHKDRLISDMLTIYWFQEERDSIIIFLFVHFKNLHGNKQLKWMSNFRTYNLDIIITFSECVQIQMIFSSHSYKTCSWRHDDTCTLFQF